MRGEVVVVSGAFFGMTAAAARDWFEEAAGTFFGVGHRRRPPSWQRRTKRGSRRIDTDRRFAPEWTSLTRLSSGAA